MFSTDRAWKEWGKRDPYFGVVTDPRFHSDSIEKNKDLFFAMGMNDCKHMLQNIKRFISVDFSPKTIMEFGCGTGRLLLPMISLTKAEAAIGCDVSSCMLTELFFNKTERLPDAKIKLCEKVPSNLAVDFVYSHIVLQHIYRKRGERLFYQLLNGLNSGGVAVIHFTISRKPFLARVRYAINSLRFCVERTLQKALRWKKVTYPAMEMETYDLATMYLIAKYCGCRVRHVELTDHHGIIGAILYLERS